MNAEQAVAYIRNYTWSTINLGLSRIQDLLDRMENPQNSLRFIHVAGTNGKGSACAMLASIFEKAGYKTGLFTSPDLVRFNERMVINGQMISDEDLARITEKVAVMADAMEHHATEFELSTAIAMQYFKEEKCDIVILEVGMGGEMDSTNVIENTEAAVLMNIGLEHTEYLGKNLKEIANTKAGIIKNGCTAVCYQVSEEVNAVFKGHAEAMYAKYAEADFFAMKLISRDTEGQHIKWRGKEKYTLALPGDQQLKNAAVVLTTVEEMRERGWNLPYEAVCEGLKEVRWPARFEIMTREPYLIVDGSHNPQCIEALAENLRDYFPERKFVFLTGVLKDKDYESMISMLFPYAKRMVCVTPNNPARALPAAELAKYVRSQGVEAVHADTYEEALELAHVGHEDVVACGSLYMVGLLRDIIVRGMDAQKAADEAEA